MSEPEFDHDEPAKPLELYRGRIEAAKNPSYGGPGRVAIEWNGGPLLQFEFLRRTADPFADVPEGDGPHVFRLTDGREFRGNVVNFEFGSRSSRMTGLVEPVAFGDGRAVTSLQTQVVNLFLTNREDVTLLSDGWRIRLNKVRDANHGGLVRHLPTYFLTTKLELTRIGRRRFDAAAGVELLDVFCQFASLARGARVGHVNLTGHNRVGREVWAGWAVADADDSGRGTDWATEYYPLWPGDDPNRSPQSDPNLMQDLWAGFLAKWRRPDLTRTMRALTSMYVQAESHTKGEAGLVVANVVLELMSWLVVVNDRAMLSADGHDRLSGADRLRLLLSVTGQDTAIPADANALGSLAHQTRWFDGPHAVTELRNSIVHPLRRRRLIGVTEAALEEARVLCMGYATESIRQWLRPAGLG